MCPTSTAPLIWMSVEILPFTFVLIHVYYTYLLEENVSLVFFQAVFWPKLHHLTGLSGPVRAWGVSLSANCLLVRYWKSMEPWRFAAA